MNKIWIVAGIINFIAALIHTILGHFMVILPFVGLECAVPVKAILHACWHMVTVTLFFSSMIFLYAGIKPQKFKSTQISILLGVPYIGFAIAFIVISFVHGVFLPHWILLLPIGILAIYGGKTA